ncbi:HD domain-containing protein [Nostoc sp. CALU 1950]|uniref:HD domain-containing protein n=1 Tax=Nostoc sp. CALU 1950 TaxID=3104321 RepID=UPI003EBACE2E
MPTENLTHILFSNWQHTLQPFGVDQVAADKAFNSLVAAYSTPGRYYHTLKHVDHVLSTIQILQGYTNNLAAVQLAAWFHDVVYDTEAQDNEERSADYALELLSNLGIPESTIATVTRLILNTKDHQAAVDDCDSQVLLDADLAILATNQVEYGEYAHAIRQEYSWVSEAEYITGRQQVLERFLKRSRIYFTPLMLEFAEPSARGNIQAEIQSLLSR